MAFDKLVVPPTLPNFNVEMLQETTWVLKEIVGQSIKDQVLLLQYLEVMLGETTNNKILQQFGLKLYTLFINQVLTPQSLVTWFATAGGLNSHLK